MLAKKCDICSALYETYNYKSNASKPSGIMLVNVCHDDDYYKHDVMDCCPKCMAAIMDTIESLKPGPMTPEPCLDEPIGEW